MTRIIIIITLKIDAIEIIQYKKIQDCSVTYYFLICNSYVVNVYYFRLVAPDNAQSVHLYWRRKKYNKSKQ